VKITSVRSYGQRNVIRVSIYFLHFFVLKLVSIPLFPSHERERDLGLYKPGMVVADCCPA
jgi:hypothetical protein